MKKANTLDFNETYLEVERRAINHWGAGASRISVRSIMESIRADLRRPLNNSFAGRVADLLVTRQPQLGELIERRAQRGPRRPAAVRVMGYVAPSAVIPLPARPFVPPAPAQAAAPADPIAVLVGKLDALVSQIAALVSVLAQREAGIPNFSFRKKVA